MARRVLVMLGLVFLCCSSASAQRSMETYAGYSYEGFYNLPNALPGYGLSGIETSFQYKFKDWFGVVGEMSGHFALPSKPATRTLNLLGGPQVTWSRRRYSPYAHFLIGYGHGYTDGTWSNSFAMAVGGGLDLRIAPLLSWRILEGDDIITHFYGATVQCPKFSTGFVFRF